MPISTTYTPYGQGYAAALLTNGASHAVTTGSGSTARQTTLATKLRQDVAVEVTLSPSALQALAQLATANTENTEAAITAKLKRVLDDIFLNSTKEAGAANKAAPKDAAQLKLHQQATDFLAGKADNPFAGKGQADLALIVVDPDGKYSINQRRAAFSEFTRLDDERLTAELELGDDVARAAADAELPPSNDPARIANARKATDYLADKTANPFAGKTRDELTAIIFNDMGDYTRNERLAALAERSVIEDKVRHELATTPGDLVRRQADREMPASSDPARLARAKQAMRFTYGLSPNPFDGLTREELNAIAYDESKTYTLNERRAAYAELSGITPPTAKAAQTLWPSMPARMKQFDPFSTDGAYSLANMRHMMNAQNTSTLLGLMGQPAGGSSANKGSLLGMLGL
jgi:hypothetical protein